jgi:hypothetical protein
MKARISVVAMAVLAAATLTVARADDSKSYTEGTVSTVTSIRTKPGMFDAYMKWLDTTGKQLRDEEKKAGIIVGYEVYSVVPRSPQDPDLYLVVTYKNMAALDGLDDREEPLTKKIWATRDAAAKADVERGGLREILGTQLVRKLDLK